MPKIVNHNERRLAIAKAAGIIIAKNGLEGTKLTDIGHIAGVTTGTITHYFSDKDAVLIAALEVAYDTMFENISKVTEKSHYTLLDVLTESLPSNKKTQRAMSIWLAFWSRALIEPKISKQQAQFRNRWTTIIMKEVQRHYKINQSPIPKDLNDIIESLTAHVNGLIIRAIIDMPDWPKKRQRKLLMEYLKAVGLHE
jgi:AcrR family transcriptional regulator